MTKVVTRNEEAIEAWDGVLFDRFVEFRDIVVTGLEQFSEEALRLNPPAVGERALDIGCGFGDTTQRLAGLVGPEGSAFGIDAAERFIEAANQEADGVPNVGFMVGDVQAAELPGPFDYAFSRMGVMFFANPVAALRNVRQSLRPGGRLCVCVWRQKIENEWLFRAEEAVKQWVEEEEDSDEPTCGPGPFSMANADTVSQQLLAAGFEDVGFRRVDIEMKIGNDLEHAVAYVCALGPAGEVLRLAGEQGQQLRPQVEAAVREVLEPWARDDGEVRAPATSWIVTATAAGPEPR